MPETRVPGNNDNWCRHIRTKTVHPFGNANHDIFTWCHQDMQFFFWGGGGGGGTLKKNHVQELSLHQEVNKKKAFIFFMRHQSSGTQNYTLIEEWPKFKVETLIYNWISVVFLTHSVYRVAQSKRHGSFSIFFAAQIIFIGFIGCDPVIIISSLTVFFWGGHLIG